MKAIRDAFRLGSGLDPLERWGTNATVTRVNVGDTVTWTNNDGTAHTVTSSDGSIQSGTLQSGQSFSYTFTTAGTFDYHCEFHANMSGQVVVQ